MKTIDLTAKATTTIHAPIEKVWEALVNPEMIRQYMFGTTVQSKWKEGSSITWKGEWNGKKYEDKGNILSIDPPKRLQYSHYSPLSNKPDIPENYHTVTLGLEKQDDLTYVILMQDHNETEQEKTHAEKNWNGMLSGLKKLVETTDPARQ